MPAPIQPAPRLVTSSRELAELARSWRGAAALGVDTEFVRTRTFYPRLGLIQIASREGTALVDPISIPDLGPLLEVLAAPEVCKVFHSCSEDLEVLYHLAEEIPRPVFDTQLAAAFCGHGHSLGYGRLVEELYGAELAKGETRTDWTRRPLSEAQLRYATQDVAYLLPLHRDLSATLARAGRKGWLEEETERLFDVERFLPEPALAYRRVKQYRTLSRRGLALLQALAQWREEAARRRDLPRGFILKDPVLIQLARRPPRNERQLASLPGIAPQTARKLGRTVLGLVREVLARPEALPPPPRRAFDTSPYKKTTQAMRGRVAERARELDLPPELLATRRQVEHLLARVATGKEPPLPKEMRGWRREVIGDDLVAMARAALP